MDEPIVIAGVPVIALVVDAAIQLCVFRIKGRRDVWGSVLFGFVVGMLITIAVSVVASSTLPVRDSIAVVLMNIASFIGLGYGYFTFVNLNFTSLRIRVLRELFRCGGRMTPEQLLGAYDAQQALTLRLNRLIEKNQLTKRDGRYYIEQLTSFLVLAYLLDGLKWLILGRPLSTR